MDEKYWLDELKELEMKQPFNRFEIDWFDSQVTSYRINSDYTSIRKISDVLSFMIFTGRISGVELFDIRKIIRKGLERG